MRRLDQVIAACMARTTAWEEEEAARLGCRPEEVQGRLREEEAREARTRALASSGITLPLQALSRIVSGRLDETEPLDVVRRWYEAELDRPILLLCGGVGVGKTLACGWAIAEQGGGSVIHAPELPRRILPTRTEIESGFAAANLRTSLLVLDDLGTEPSAGQPRWAEAFAILVEKRIMLGRTIVTSNMEKGQFRARYGERVASRLNAHAYAVELQAGGSLRATGGGL